MITYATSTQGMSSHQLQGFFVGWANRPSPEAHLRILQRSDHVVVARDDMSGEIVGFITAISDGVWVAYIPLLEVKSPWRSQGIGHQLLQRMLAELDGFYMVDTLCDPDVQAFYEGQGMLPATGACIRHYENQSGPQIR